MTLTFELDLDRVRMNQYTKYQRAFRLKVIIHLEVILQTNTHTHLTRCSRWTSNYYYYYYYNHSVALCPGLPG